MTVIGMGSRLLVALLLAGGLSGCVLDPAPHVDYQTETAPVDDLVEVVPITPALVSAYARRESNAQPMTEAQREALENYTYKVGPGDVLSIIVYGHPELTIPAGAERSAAEAGNLVRSDGSIFYPYIGHVQVAGLTSEEIRTELTERLSEYLSDPQIDVLIARYGSQKAFVTGAISSSGGGSRTGVLEITEVPLTVTEAIARSGELRSNANWHHATLTRRNGEIIPVSLYELLREGDQSQNYLLRHGDILHVPTAVNQGVAVMGEVRNPLNVTMGEERLSLTDVLARAGGLDQEGAEPTGVFVLRPKPAGSRDIATVYQLDVRNAVGFTMASRFPMRPQDLVYVTTAPLARWNRVIDLLLPSMDYPGDVVRSRDDIDELF